MFCNIHLHYPSPLSSSTNYARINMPYMWVDICHLSQSSESQQCKHCLQMIAWSIRKQNEGNYNYAAFQFQCTNTIAWLPNAISHKTGGWSFEQTSTLYSQQWYLSIHAAGLTGWSSICCNVWCTKLRNTKYMNPVFKLLLIKFCKDHNSHTVPVRRNCISTIDHHLGDM